MNPMSQQDALKWIAQTFEESPDKITPATPREEIAAWDSLGVLTLMAGLDQEMGIVLSDAEIRSLNSVGDILEILRKNGKLAE